jgi:protein-L-isoaspartate(D-aspartate) O-methyltransferase
MNSNCSVGSDTANRTIFLIDFQPDLRYYTIMMLRILSLLLIPFLFANCAPRISSPSPSTITFGTPQPQTPTADAFTAAREEMVSTQIEARDVSDPAVLTAMRIVPRHAFVPSEFLDQAYADHPLPIGYGQTISQPYIVALMTEALHLESGQRVLEIGTGSGYQAAVLAEMDVEVYTIEIIPELVEQARQRLDELGYTKVETLNADGYFGWEENAPFDAIIVTAAPDHLPQPLANQLAEGGRLIIPIGPVGLVQTLWLFEKINSELQATNLGGVRFVPLTGEH